MSENTEDRKYMGTKNEAEAKLIAASRAWRETRQPMMGTRADLNANDVAERELRFCLANAALLWLWHQENPDPVLSPVPISSEKMELADDLVERLRSAATDLCHPTGCCYGNTMTEAADEIVRLRASPPAQDPVTTEKNARKLATWIGYSWDGLRDDSTIERGFPEWSTRGTYQGGKADLLRVAAALAIPAPPQPGREPSHDLDNLRSASRKLISAMDDMHQRGETFTARVSLAASALRKLLAPTWPKDTDAITGEPK
jgi:hypothetical protein